MREVNGTELWFTEPSGGVVTIKLGPVLPTPAEPPVPPTAAQREEATKKSRRYRLRLMLASSGVKLSEDQLDEMSEVAR